MRKTYLLVAAALLSIGCSHIQLSGSDLHRVHHPAFLARMDEEGGPRSLVFRKDDAFRERLKKMEPREADRRLTLKLVQGMGRFEIAERLRGEVAARISRVSPWTDTINPAEVATALQSFLVVDIPAQPPDYDVLKPLGADAVVEMVIEDCGLKSENGKAGVFAKGYGRMFMIGGSTIWRKSFDVDQTENGTAALDPFRIAKNPDVFRASLGALLDGVAEDFAHELEPAGYEPDPSAVPRRQIEPGPNELSAPPDDTNKAGRRDDELPSSDAAERRPNPEELGGVKMHDAKPDRSGDHPATAPGLQEPNHAPLDGSGGK